MTPATRHSLRKPALVFLSAALLVSATVLAPGCGEERPENPSLTILYSGTILGKAEPCGCFSGDFGGILRACKYIRQVRAEQEHVIYFDLGDLFFEFPQVSDFERQQFHLKSRMMLNALGDAGCEGFVPGDLDFAAGWQFLRDLHRESPIPFLSANLVRASDETPVFHPWEVLEIGPWKIGVFGLMGQQLNEPVTALREESIDVNQQMARRGLKVLDPVETAGRMVTKLRQEQQCDMVLLAGHIGLAMARRIAAEVPGIDIILTSHFIKEDLAADRDPVNGTHIGIITLKGSRIGRIDLYGDPTNPDRLDNSQRADLREHVIEDRRELKHLLERLRVKRDRDSIAHRITLETRIERTEEVLADLLPADGKDVYERFTALLDEWIGIDETADRLMRDYHLATQAMWSREGAGGRVPMGAGDSMKNYVGYQACVNCHPHQTEFWESTGHARAYATLEATQQELDVECFRCHTAGWMAPGAFKLPLGAQEYGFVNVQCESCHGPGEYHSRGGEFTVRPGAIAQAPSEAACTVCHNKDHDPDFLFHVKLPKVACPKTPPGDQTLRATRESAVAALRHDLKSAPLSRRVILGRVLLNLERPAEALEALKVFGRPGSRNVVGRYLLARAMHETGNFTDANRIGMVLIKEDPAFGDPYEIVALSLIEQGKSNEALQILQEAVSYHPTRLDLLGVFFRLIHRHLGVEALEEAVFRHGRNYPESAAALYRVASRWLEDEAMERIGNRWQAAFDKK